MLFYILKNGKNISNPDYNSLNSNSKNLKYFNDLQNSLAFVGLNYLDTQSPVLFEFGGNGIDQMGRHRINISCKLVCNDPEPKPSEGGVTIKY